MASADRLISISLLLLLGLGATIAGVTVPVAFACPFGQGFEYDGCVPSPFLYVWNSSSPASAETPHSCTWDMPWGRVNLPCNLMNCQSIIYPQGYTPHSQPASCSSLAVSIKELVNGVPIPINGHDVLVTANLTCTGPAQAALQADINVTMSGKTDSSGSVTFLIPSSLGSNSSETPKVNCFTVDWPDSPSGSGLTARDLNVGIVSADIPWPPLQNRITIWLPPISTRVPHGLGRGFFIL